MQEATVSNISISYLVIEDRINGNLNLSRALGDMEYKKDSKLKPKNQIITSAPDLVKRVYKIIKIIS